MNIKIEKAQQLLSQEGIDGWLLYDFRRSNPLACHFLKIPAEGLLSRRFFYWIPKKGNPIKFVSFVENPLKHLPGETTAYRSWQDLENQLQTLLKNKKIAMEYSPRNAIPAISKVDGGTLELIRSFDATVISSGNLLQQFTSVWDDKKIKMHREVALILNQTVEKTWDWIAQKLESSTFITEWDVQQFVVTELRKADCIFEHPPIAAVNHNSANPHYSPNEENAEQVKKGDFILIDLWAKLNLPEAVYADITRVGIAREKPTNKEEEIFTIVREAQLAAITYIEKRHAVGHAILGCDVDDICRNVIEASGYGSFFVHRTGHNIDEEDHGHGAHIDNLETHDDRMLLVNTCFSIEPGIYLSGEFGVRLECDVLLLENGQVEVTGGLQSELKRVDRKILSS